MIQFARRPTRCPVRCWVGAALDRLSGSRRALKLFREVSKPGAETSRLMMDLARVDRSGPEEPRPILGGLLRTTITTSCVLAACLGLLVVLVVF